jgi:hypothetical protein
MLKPFKSPLIFFFGKWNVLTPELSTSAAQDPSTTFHSSTLLHPSIGFFHPHLSYSFLAFIRPHMTVIRPLGFYPSTWFSSVHLAFFHSRNFINLLGFIPSVQLRPPLAFTQPLGFYSSTWLSFVHLASSIHLTSSVLRFHPAPGFHPPICLYSSTLGSSIHLTSSGLAFTKPLGFHPSRRPLSVQMCLTSSSLLSIPLNIVLLFCSLKNLTPSPRNQVNNKTSGFADWRYNSIV